ncbi:MBL fold metallo-hydrolase [Helicobacter cappadocius]|uniref:MBL fold metallo-hydrolase n=1 Tax=Helicobacter cappadocius TaxID=3063998 RepID=A0AA90PTT1_9HELI|nr:MULTISPECIES: MBL fold metallo-hydrolase [unclassified Helicobacter]MDO7252732.1 MBL fold metallo-hydrolase [Helicobacter sp. faydin-H75]MDP2538600.1 MBL fold metallo-hydrolase [Helicobacter sp. faydin-H76]
MKLLKKAFGAPQTNCYIYGTSKGDFIVDPGIGASEWVLENSTNPLAILITHGHYDHIWSLAELKSNLPNTPIYCPKKDVFMLETDCFQTGLTPCTPSNIIEGEKSTSTLKISDYTIKYHHLPGHTPGCSIIEIDNIIFSGDFIFYRSIGRYDFPYSNPSDMKESLIRFRQIQSDTDKTIYPGHGQNTSLFQEQKNADLWIKRI